MLQVIGRSIAKRMKYIYFILRMMLSHPKLFRKFLIATGLTTSLIVIAFKLAKKMRKYYSRLNNRQNNEIANIEKKEENVNLVRSKNPSLNRQFYRELLYLLRIMFPKVFCKQSALLFLHTGTLICRTFLSIYVAKLEGLLVRNIVNKSSKLFAKYLIYWLLIAIPATKYKSDNFSAEKKKIY